MTIFALILTIIGGLNWLLVGALDFDLVAWLFAGDLYWLARVVYVLVGLAAIWLIWYLIRNFKNINLRNKE